ncbi:hypothetical protein RS130_05185 [Paraglaciecola aquimarina]|uniref:Sulfatase N-terminal domain-containing protein n=1 Tax=Paraglaciecola aquimarina TaxID=1235557 RepID=A0ABU3STR9_9ALTE|nr:hypothetical protein [Paraglaciecola aquimarina]MDU0353404.1 hypothetical protein [Paraglaciecola aquimarina]
MNKALLPEKAKQLRSQLVKCSSGEYSQWGAFVRLIILFSLLLSSLPVCSSARQPNIVLIMADDVSWEVFESYGSKEYSTPNLSKLAVSTS